MVKNLDSHSRGFWAVILGGITIGSSAIFMRFAEVTPTSAAFWRAGLSVPIFIILMLMINRRALVPTQPMPIVARDLLIVGFWFAADLTLWHWSVETTTVANATLLANMASVFTPIIGYFLFKERYGKKFVMGLMMALAGAFTLIGQNAQMNPDYFIGDMLGLATAVALASYMVAGAKARKRHATVFLMAGSSFVTALFLLPIALMETGDFIPTGFDGWWPVIALAVVTHVSGQGLIMYGLAHVSAAVGSVSLLIQPVIAAILAWIIFNEALGLLHIVGGVLIMSGIMLAKKGNG